MFDNGLINSSDEPTTELVNFATDNADSDQG